MYQQYVLKVEYKDIGIKKRNCYTVLSLSKHIHAVWCTIYLKITYIYTRLASSFKDILTFTILFHYK